MDAVTGLPCSKNDSDAILVEVDKFTKAVRLLPGKTVYTAVDWAKHFFQTVWPH